MLGSVLEWDCGAGSPDRDDIKMDDDEATSGGLKQEEDRGKGQVVAGRGGRRGGGVGEA